MIKSLANFSLYLASFVASTVITLAAPNELLRGYLATYTLASVVFSLAFFLYFAGRPSMRGVKLISFGLVAAAAVASLGFGLYASALLMYPGVLIYSDYVVTQSCDLRRVTSYRLFLIFSSALFLLGPQYFEYNMIARVALIFMVALALLRQDGDIHKISVKSPIRYLVGNYLFYSGTLYAVTMLTDHGDGLRFWYIVSQAGLVVIIKYYDFSLRKSYIAVGSVKLMVMAVAFLLPLPLMFFYASYLNLVLYYIGYLGLLYTGKFIAR